MTHFKKSRIPYEIKNAREWDPRRKAQDSISSEDEDDHDFEHGYRDGTLASSHERPAKPPEPLIALEDDNDGFQPVIRRFTKSPRSEGTAYKSAGTKQRKATEVKKHPMDGNTRSSLKENLQPEPPSRPVAITKTTTNPQILLNQHGKCVDSDVQYDPEEVDRIIKLKLCVRHFLINGCRSKETCPYNHKYQPTKYDLQTLRFIAKRVKCRLHPQCTDAKCIYGHHTLKDAASQTSQATRKAPLMTLQPIANRQIPIDDEISQTHRSSPERFQPIFRFQRDNFAKAAFRRREACTGNLVLHKKIIEIEPDPGFLEMFLEELGLRIGSFIRPPQSAQDRELMIWGSLKQVSKTQEELKNWIRRSEIPEIGKALSRGKFARERSTIGVKYQEVQREIAKKAQIHRFQQIPDPDQPFEYQGAYLWPVEDAIPQDIFGPNLEAFDQMRFVLKSHIVFDNGLNILRIYTDEGESVAKALKLIEGTLKEFHARNGCTGRSSSSLFVDPPRSKNFLGGSVKMQTWSSSAESSIVHYLPLLTSDTSDPKSLAEWKSQREGITMSNALKIQEALEFVVPSINFLRGQVSMKILFGTFALTQFKSPKGKLTSVPFEDFRRILTDEGTKGQMIRDLRLDRRPSEIFDEIRSLADALKPLDSEIEPLDRASRTYGARFEINRFEKPGLQLEVVMEDIAGEEGLLDRTHSVWARLDRKDNNIPVDISMLRLEGGASWKLQILTEHQMDKWDIDKQMADFADTVKIKGSKSGAELDGRRLFDWGSASPGFLKPSVFEQKIALRYRLAYDQALIFEIARYDSYDLSISARTPSTTHWGASMWNSDWDLILSENAGLGLGECANWDARLQTFFPHPDVELYPGSDLDPGLRSFLANVRKAAKVLDRIIGGEFRCSERKDGMLGCVR